tara:strand:+ start:2095 stop:2514 length:420 start_codon:yes stop_codon:yes gene_type:complete
MNFVQDGPPTIRDLAERTHQQRLRNRKERFKKRSDIYSDIDEGTNHNQQHHEIHHAPPPPMPEALHNNVDDIIHETPPAAVLNGTGARDFKRTQIRPGSPARVQGKTVHESAGVSMYTVIFIAMMCIGLGAILTSLYMR